MLDTTDVVIVGMGRTPRSKFGGTLRSMGPTELAAAVMPKVLVRTGGKLGLAALCGGTGVTGAIVIRVED